MKRDYKLYLQDIKESIRNIEEYLGSVSQEGFSKDKKLQDAVIRRLEIIGEASRNIPRVLKEKNNQIPWFDMSQFRDFIVHSYFTASMERVWKIVKTRLPDIKEGFKNIKMI